MKKLFYDLETTGLSHNKHGIHQIACILVIDGLVVEKFSWDMQPNPKCLYDDYAVKMSHKSEAEMRDCELSMRQAHSNFLGILGKYVDKYNRLDKIHLIGYNNRRFDDLFLRAWFDHCDDRFFGSWFWSDSIDVMVLASDKLKRVRKGMKNFKLHTVAKQVGIKVEEGKLHEAMYDTELTKKIYNKVKFIK